MYRELARAIKRCEAKWIPETDEERLGQTPEKIAEATRFLETLAGGRIVRTSLVPYAEPVGDYRIGHYKVFVKVGAHNEESERRLRASISGRMPYVKEVVFVNGEDADIEE
jgi:hypothetical protein